MVNMVTVIKLQPSHNLTPVGKRWTWERGGGGGGGGLLRCLGVFWRKRGWRFDKWFIIKTLVPKLKL